MKLVTELGMGQKEADLLLQAVIDGGVSLLFGAGLSYDNLGGDKAQLKGGPDLARQINAELGLGLVEPDASNLPLVYGDAAQTPSKTKLNRLLINRYSNCQATWQKSLFEMPWKRVWTLNIDDILERAHTFGSTLKIFNWFDDFKPRNRGTTELQLIHLHGRASELNTHPDHLIFSIKEYATRSEQSPGWHTEFHSEFAQKPFIVCGARMQEEFDLISVLEYGNRSYERGGSPSIIVLREFAPGQADRFKRQGLIAVSASGEQFFSALYSDFITYKNAHPEDSPEYLEAKSEVRSKFRRLERNKNSGQIPVKNVLDFYGSAESQWSHIVDNLDALLPVVQNATQWLTSRENTNTRLLLFHGGFTCGKSAAALRVALDCLSLGYEVELFRSEEIFDPNTLVNYLRIRKNIVLVFDDCADYSSSIRLLTEEAVKQRVQLRLVATTDEKRLRGVQPDFDEAATKEIALDPLRHDSFDAIFVKRLAKGRLGRCTPTHHTSQQDSWNEFRSIYNFRLLEWLESLEKSALLGNAVHKIFADQARSPSPTRSLLCATATVQRFSHSLPLHLANRFRRNLNLDELIAENGSLNTLAYIDERGLRLRSRAFAWFVWHKLTPGDKYIWTQTLLKLLAPLVVPLSISRRSTPYMIARNLMDWEVVKRDLGTNAEAWFGELEPLYGWNARFWEQRALLANDNDHHSIAYSYAKKAVQRHSKDSFVWNTLGKICVQLGTIQNNSFGIERFWEGIAALENSRKLSSESGLDWEHPYNTFFNYSLKMINLEVFQAEKPRLLLEWTEWMRLAKRSKGFSRNPAKLDDYQYKWLQLAISK